MDEVSDPGFGEEASEGDMVFKAEFDHGALKGGKEGAGAGEGEVDPTPAPSPTLPQGGGS